MEKKVYFEYSDGSILEAVITDGKLTKCPDIRLSPPAPTWGGGALTIDEALEFLADIRLEIAGQMAASQKSQVGTGERGSPNRRS